MSKAFSEAIVNWPFCADFEREYGAHFIKLLENSLLVQDARIIRRSCPRVSAVGRLLEGGRRLQHGVPRRDLQFYGLLKHMESTDRAERREDF